MSEQKTESKSDIFTAIGTILKTFTQFFVTVMWSGARYGIKWNMKIVGIWVFYFLWLTMIVFGPRWNLGVLLQLIVTPIGMESFGVWLGSHIPRWLQLFVFFTLPFCSWLFALGIKRWLQMTKHTRALSHLGLKTPTGIAPKIAKIVELESSQRRVLIHAVGLDVETFRKKKGAMESSFNAIVQDIRVFPSNRQMVDVLLSDKELPRLVQFDDYSDRLVKPYTFLVGETMDGFIVCDLCEVHHMLVAGSTGGGKSVFFKQALIGLLQSSKHIQLYLLDLKRGVELRPFEALENVDIAKDEASAVATLQVVVAEMEKRFKLLEQKEFTEIRPERDSLDRIVVAIDEASVLFTIEKTSKENKALAQNARELTDKIAKLGRAAGIHLILATQKVVKETIDTRVQTNINAKMCFRVNTIASSMTVLGNKKAADLPDVKGRGIWSVGSNDVVVQVPYLDNEAITEEINLLTAKFNGAASPLKQEMLQVMVPKEDKSELLKQKSEDEPNEIEVVNV